MFLTKVIKNKIYIAPHELGDYKVHIMEKLKCIEGKCSDFGFVRKVKKINNISFDRLDNQHFYGNIIVDVKYTVEYINPQVGDKISVNVIQDNEIYIGKNANIMSIIQSEKKLTKGDIVDITILKTQIIHGSETIRVIGIFE